MLVRMTLSIFAVLIYSAMLAGCLSDSGSSDGIHTLRKGNLGDTAGISSSPYAVSLPNDSGFAAIWIRRDPFAPQKGSVVLQRVDGKGQTVFNTYENYPDTVMLSSPRISAFPDGGLACAWTTSGRSPSNEIPVIKILESGHGPGYPEEIHFPQSRRAYRVNILALPDKGFELCIQGIDSIACRHFGPNGKPDRDWSRHAQCSNTVEFERREGGGWILFWSSTNLYGPFGSSDSGSAIHWQFFDPNGNPEGPERFKLADLGDGFQPIRTQRLSGGRILVQIRDVLRPADFFILDESGELGVTVAPPEGMDVVDIACDSLRHRCYGIGGEGLVRMDEDFQIQATRKKSDAMDTWPLLNLDAAGRLVLISNGNDTRPSWERRSLHVWIAAPF